MTDEQGSLRLSPAALRDVAYVLAFVFSGGIFYSNQASHGEKIRELQGKSEAKEHRLAEAERRISVIEEGQKEQDRRIQDEEQELREHITHDVVLQAGRK